MYGKVEIYINKTTINSIKQFSSSNNNISMFSRKGQFMNRLILTNKDDLYCDHCLYIVAVVALKVTESTLFYGD